MEKPAVSPHPPIAIMMAVPLANFERTSAIVVNNGHDVGCAVLKVAEFMNARATCVISDTRCASGTTLCCLGFSFISVEIQEQGSRVTYPVRYMT